MLWNKSKSFLCKSSGSQPLQVNRIHKELGHWVFVGKHRLLSVPSLMAWCCVFVIKGRVKWKSVPVIYHAHEYLGDYSSNFVVQVSLSVCWHIRWLFHVLWSALFDFLSFALHFQDSGQGLGLVFCNGNFSRFIYKVPWLLSNRLITFSSPQF